MAYLPYVHILTRKDLQVVHHAPASSFWATDTVAYAI